MGMTIAAICCGVLAAFVSWTMSAPREAKRLASVFRQARRAWWLFCQRRRIERQWPDALFLMAGALRAGMTVQEAVDLLLAEAPEPLRAVLAERMKGKSAWLSTDQIAARIFIEPALSLIRASVQMSLESGGSLAPLLESGARRLLKKEEMRDKVAALTAQGRASAWIVGLAPLALFLSLFFLAPDYVQPLWNTPAGRALSGAAGLLVLIGFFLVQRIARVND